MNRDVCEHFNPVDLPCAKCAEKVKDEGEGMTQSEALRLADELDHGVGTIDRVRHEAAAELRRLAGVETQRDALMEFAKYVERCKAVLNAASEGWRADAERWQAQRDALLEFAKYVEAIDPGNPAPLFEKAREAIKKAEGV